MAFQLPQLVVQDELTQYKIERLEGLDAAVKRGHGSYGAVYEVKVNGIPCIAKRLHDILVGHDINEQQRAQTRRNFRRECELLSSLRHPNIVQFLGVHFGSEPNDLTLVMEYLHTDLEVCLKQYKQAMPLSIKLAILLDISYGLLHLHSQHPTIIHRDLTAGNVLLTPDMRAKLADLGVSKIIDFSLSNRMNRFTGCPGAIPYMPPEALRRDPRYDVKLDIFSFGVLALYVVIEEVPPFYLEANIPEVAMQQGRAQIEKRKDSIDKIPPRHCLRELVLSCLMDDPGTRPTTGEVNHMVGALSAIHPKSFGNVIEMHQALKVMNESYAGGLAGQPRVAVVQRDALLERAETLTQENTRLKEELEARQIEASVYKEDFAHERRDRANLAGKNEELKRNIEQLRKELDREQERRIALEQRPEYGHGALQPGVHQSSVANPTPVLQQTPPYGRQTLEREIDPTTNPFVSLTHQHAHHVSQTPPYSGSPTQARKHDQQNVTQTPAAAPPHTLGHSVSIEPPSQTKKIPPFVSSLSSPDGEEHLYQNLNREDLFGPVLRERVTRLPSSASRLTPKDESRFSDRDYVNVKVRPQTLSSSATRKHSEGSKTDRFSQSEGSCENIFRKAQREIQPFESQPRQKIFERSNSGGYRQFPLQQTYDPHVPDKQTSTATKSSTLTPTYGQQRVSHDGAENPIRKSRSFSGSLNSGECAASFLPLDPNLVCLKCGRQFREGEIQIYRTHYKSCV